VNSTRLGPVGDPYTVSPSGSSRCSFQSNAATIYSIASTGAMLLYRAETRQRRNAALAAEPCCASDFNSREDAWHSPHTLLTQFLSHTTTPTGWPLLLSPSPLVGFRHHQLYSDLGADTVMESITYCPGMLSANVRRAAGQSSRLMTLVSVRCTLQSRTYCQIA